MSNGFFDVVAKIPPGGSRSMLGTVTTEGGVRKVNVNGSLLVGRWADPMVVDDGDVVTVTVSGRGSTAVVDFSARTTDQPRPRTGIVTGATGGFITVTANGVSYPAEPVYSSPTVGDNVHLEWGAGTPRAIGKVTTAPPKEPVVAVQASKPSSRPKSGRVTAHAKLSRTYWAGGGWGSYGGDGKKVYQGTYANATVTGAWFYGAPFRALQGRTITRVTFRTGQRLPGVGSYGAPAVFHFYAHTSPTQPKGDTNRVVGPFDWTATPNAGPKTIDLPLSFAAALVAGGGIAIAGNPYTAMQGTTRSSPDSGTLTLYWED